MNKREMALFEAVGRTGSVTLAAATTGMSQPAASAMLKSLEDKLGFALFSREKRRLALTAEARMLLPEIVHALAAMDNAERVAASMRGGAQARLDVGAVAAVGASILPGAMAWLQARERGVRVSVRTDMTLGVAILDSMSGLYARRHGLSVVPVDVEGGLDLSIVWPLNRGLGRVARQLEAGLEHELSQTTE